MNGIRITAYDANTAYLRVLQSVLEEDDAPTVRGEAMSGELLGVTVHIVDATRPIITIPERKLNYRLMVAEALWNLVPLSYDFMRKFNKRADVFVSDQPEYARNVARWHYGHVLRHEIPRVVTELRKDPYTRRAVYTLPQIHPQVSQGTPPCLIGQQFLYRDGALHCITTMRSNDVWLGTPLDFFQFMLFQHLVAAGAGLPVGSFTLQAGSLHLYSRDKADAERVAKNETLLRPESLRISNRAYSQFECGILGMALSDINAGRALGQCGEWQHFIDVLVKEAALC